jgi:hypothetical protein
VATWSNSYRSGDYIGRHLWWDDSDPRRFDPAETFVGPRRKEFCTGAGAHTHYWESEAQPVAVELDRLITDDQSSDPRRNANSTTAPAHSKAAAEGLGTTASL